MTRTESDADAIERSKRDAEAFGLIFDRHHDAVHNYLRRRVGGQQADEWLGETFAQAFRARARYAPAHDTCLPWLLGIATHLIANHRRAERRRLAAIERAATAQRAAEGGRRPDDPAALTAQRTLDPELARALRRMERRDRDVLLLHVWADLSYAEVAEALELPVGTVRSRLNRARARLRDQLGARRGGVRARAPESTPIAGDGHA